MATRLHVLIGTALGFAAGAAAAMARYAPLAFCEYEVRKVARAPARGTADALIYHRNCGAIMSGREGVALAPPGTRALTEAGNWDNVFTYIGARNPTALNWAPDGRLVVEYDARADVLRQVVVSQRTRIDYRAR